MEENLTKKDVAKLLRVSVRTVDYLRASGELIFLKIENRVRFLPEDVEAFLKRHRVTPVPVPVEKKKP